MVHNQPKFRDKKKLINSQPPAISNYNQNTVSIDLIDKNIPSSNNIVHK